VLEACFLTSSRVNRVRPLLALTLGVADFDGEGLSEALCDALGDALAEALTDVLDEGFAFTRVPLFQTSFLPFLTQKYLTPPVVLVDPIFLQEVPAIVAACEGIEIADRNTAAKRTMEYALNFIH